MCCSLCCAARRPISLRLTIQLREETPEPMKAVLPALARPLIEAQLPDDLDVAWFATPEEVASLVAYVASPLASATTGAALRVDGGVIRSVI